MSNPAYNSKAPKMTSKASHSSGAHKPAATGTGDKPAKGKKGPHGHKHGEKKGEKKGENKDCADLPSVKEIAACEKKGEHKSQDTATPYRMGSTIVYGVYPSSSTSMVNSKATSVPDNED